MDFTKVIVLFLASVCLAKTPAQKSCKTLADPSYCQSITVHQCYESLTMQKMCCHGCYNLLAEQRLSSNDIEEGRLGKDPLNFNARFDSLRVYHQLTQGQRCEDFNRHCRFLVGTQCKQSSSILELCCETCKNLYATGG